MQLLTFNIVLGQHIYKSGTTGLLSLYTENFNIKGLVQIGIMGHEPNLLGDQFDHLIMNSYVSYPSLPIINSAKYIIVVYVLASNFLAYAILGDFHPSC